MPFGYFGRKGKLARRYPEPRHGMIVEPFAGSAAYSLHGDYWKNDVILVEIDERVCRLWEWLIDDATEQDILSLPDYRQGDTINGDDPLHDLVRLSAPSDNWKGKSTITSRMARDWGGYQRRLLGSLPKIKHWKIIHGDYTLAPDITATWFIDPPYQEIEHGYGDSRSSINYEELGEWSRGRDGLVIVCEKIGANWLEFRHLYEAQTINDGRVQEAIWTTGRRR